MYIVFGISNWYFGVSIWYLRVSIWNLGQCICLPGFVFWSVPLYVGVCIWYFKVCIWNLGQYFLCLRLCILECVLGISGLYLVFGGMKLVYEALIMRVHFGIGFCISYVGMCFCICTYIFCLGWYVLYMG